MVRTSRRLPGFRFEVQPPPLTEVLPRMDVPVFVGFAASGPLDTPVPVEDIALFEEIFGRDAPLAWDPERGETVSAYLAPAVRAFFRNGGQRCWIVRVAGQGVTLNHYAAPLTELDEFGKRGPVMLQARSEGSWSDTLEVASVLSAEVLSLPTAAAAGSPPDPLSVLAKLADQQTIARGDLLRLTFLQDGSDQRQILLLAVGGTSDQAKVEIKPGNSLWIQTDDPTKPMASPPALPATLSGLERLTFALEVRQGQTASWRLAGLGFAPCHPRYWANLPSDYELYSSTDTTAAKMLPPLWAAAANPRFPLAGFHTTGVCFPLGMPLVADNYRRLEEQRATALERDGLDRFEAGLFFDRHDPRSFRSLIEAGTRDLLAEADFQRYEGPEERALGGIHAALGIDEATIIAVPDAVHRGWSLAGVVEPASPVESSPLVHREWWRFLRCDPAPKIPRVRAPELGHFLDCGLIILAAPHLYVEESVDLFGSFALAWTEVQDASYVLEEATDPSFFDAAVIFTGPSSECRIYGRPPGNYYYRVRAQRDGVSSDYSDGIGLQIAPPSRWHLDPVDSYSDATLLAVQRGMLRLCAARADLLAVLALPEHYRETNATQHVDRLTSSAGPALEVTDGSSPVATAHSRPLALDEASAFSSGAIYHPWLIETVADATTDLRRTPPDGAVCGIMARRALARGAWIAPANEFFKGVVALAPPISRQSRQILQDAQINLIRQEPHGFVALSADTLSDDVDLRPINVRRLLILLRRLALRLGVSYVFEPNDDSFRRAVQRGFEAQLEYLFMRGAFAGKTADASFQVVTDSSVNTPQSMEQGRFIVELRVAPSLPMSFLTIRLVQTGDRNFVTEVS
jgi:hypothetical protein